MAQLSSLKALSFISVVAVSVILFASASAQGLGMAPAPAPSIDNGSAHSLPVSGEIVCASVALSLLGLMKH